LGASREGDLAIGEKIMKTEVTFMEQQASAVWDAVVYSCIAFSIVFIVLGGLTVVIHAMRLTAGSSETSAKS
jgi:hypothetical protein